MRVPLLIAGMLGLSAPLLAQSIGPSPTPFPVIKVLDQPPMEYDLTADGYPDGVQPGVPALPVSVLDGARVSLSFAGPIQITLVGVASDGTLQVTGPAGSARLTVHCLWADEGTNGWAEFPCTGSGGAGPVPLGSGTVRRVTLRAVTEATAAQTRNVPAGRYTGIAYFRVDSR